MAQPRSGTSGNLRLIAAGISLATGVVVLVILGVVSLVFGWRLFRPALGHIRKDSPKPALCSVSRRAIL